jgi:hypothetical protein
MWVFIAGLNDYEPSTWIARKGYLDLSNQDLYIAAVYFTVTTITTVGFGDIAP